ncbi:PREDICTED: adhesion G-protein coupled receptor G2 isoform X3 [Crocodylus porosus]|uniref:adhesion G-protein coupled receptor G2 isoform X3 n=1 Tax=Crocodylus porosus TaxID=8502 RepID=UPI000938A6D5|nr:PREDICTED: adhesion G-protein coupled receptor G2 isoform X3 [Crocodylus porosus]
MIASGVRYCCASRIQELLLKFKISLAITLLHLLLTTAGKAQDGFLGKYKAVFKTACEEAWTLSPGISVPPLKEFTICLYLKLLTSSDPWTAFVYVKETPESIQSVKKYELGLTGDGNKLTVWLFGYHIDLTENFHLDDLQQVCIEWKSTDNEMKLFINGRKKRSRKLDGKLEKLTLDGNGQFLLGCSQPSRTASSSAVGMVGELYMFRMWDKADIKLSHDCIDGSVISWRRKYWAYNHTIEESNTLPCASTVHSRLSVLSRPVTITDAASLQNTSTEARTLRSKANQTDTNSEDTTDSAVDAVKSNLPVATTIADTASEEITHTSETINGLDLNTSTTSDTTSEETTHSRGTLSENIIINTVQPLPTNINETEPNHLCNSSVICNDSVFYMGKVKFQSSEEINTSLNVEIINNISSKQVTKLIPLATHTLQDPTISEFNKTLQKISESSVMECAAENQSLPVCSFIIKVARTMNISNSMATVRGNMEISQIEQYCCSALQSCPSTSEELQILQHNVQDPAACACPPTSPAASSAKHSVVTFHPCTPPPKSTAVSPLPLPTKPTTKMTFTINPASKTFNKLTTTIHSSIVSTYPTTKIPLSSKPTITSPTKPITKIPSVMPSTHTTTISPNKPAIIHPPPVSSTKSTTLVPATAASAKPNTTTTSGTHPTADGHDSPTNGNTGDTTRATINASTPEDIVSEMEKALSAGNLEPKVAEKMVNSISGLLNSSVSIPSSMSKRIIQLVDTIGLRLNFSTKSINFTSPSLALAVIKVNSSSFSKMSFAVQDSSDLQITLGIQAPTNNVGAITLPSSLLMDLPSEETDLASRIIFNFYEKTTVFQDPSLENLSLISKVISSSVANLTVNNLKANVTVTLQNTRPYQDNLTVRCAFWDFNKNSGQGGWSSEGCTVKERTPNETVCSCNHLTSFAVLLDLSRNTTLSAKQELVLTFISYIGCGLSAVFLSVTLVTYVAFEKLRRDYPSKILIQLCAALLLLNLVFLLDSWIALYNVRGLCITVAVFLHYFLLVSFTWMGLEAFHMYLALVKVFNTYIRKYILKFCIVGWGVPAVIVAIVLAITPDNYGLGSYGKFPNGTPDEFCWINSSIAFYITVVGYFCMIFLLNVSMFIVVLIQLCRIKKKKQLGTQRKTSIQDLRSVAGLTFLLGITWGFAFFAWGPVNLIFMYLFAIFNTLQGFFIFIFYCVAKENVRKQWRRYLCCGKFRLAENSDWSRTATNGLKKQTVNQGVSSSSNSLQSNSNSTNSTTLLMNNDYSVHANGNGHLPSEKNGVSFNVQNGDVRLHDFSGKQLIFYEKDETDNKNSRISLRRTSKRGSLHFIERM